MCGVSDASSDLWVVLEVVEAEEGGERSRRWLGRPSEDEGDEAAEEGDCEAIWDAGHLNRTSTKLQVGDLFHF